MNECPVCGLVKGLHGSILPGCTCVGTFPNAYQAPQQREWVGLTDDEIADLDCVYLDDLGYGESEINQVSVNIFAAAIEAKLKEKNA